MLLLTWRRLRKFIQYCYGTGALLKNGQTYKKKTFQACAKGGMSLLGPLGLEKLKMKISLKNHDTGIPENSSVVVNGQGELPNGVLGHTLQTGEKVLKKI